VWSAAAVHECITQLATSKGLALGKLAQPLRLAMCGGTVSPPIDATLAILGKHETLARLRTALSLWNA
jgi:glutamyl-tRNA synthetase